MNSFNPFRKTVIAAIVVSMGLCGCATPNGGAGGGSSNVFKTEDGQCNTGLAAAAGAIAGALLAKGENRVRGAALGAGLASLACVAFNYSTKQTKTAEQVRQEYKTAHGGRDTPVTKVTNFATTLNPQPAARPGSEILIHSDIDVVQGTKDAVAPVVEEEIVLTSPDGQEKKARKRANANGTAGGFSTDFRTKLPSDVGQGDYPIRTVLYLNGQQVSENNGKVQVVMVDGERRVQITMAR